MNKALLIVLLAAGIIGCTKEFDFKDIENNSSGDKRLEIVTQALSYKSTRFIQEFAEGSVIGLHITNGMAGDIYEGQSAYKNIKAQATRVNDKLNWQQAPPVYLSHEPATIFAYCPYQPQVNFDATQIPVRLSPDASQTSDYMYGTQAAGQKTVNKVSPFVLLNMKHALSEISFQISLDKNKPGSFRLSSIQIGNKAGGAALASRGTMNISTGKITPIAETNASTRLKLPIPIELRTTPSEAHYLKVIPTACTTREGEIEALFTINGRTYTYPIPAQTEWRKGYIYLYKVRFNGKDIKLHEMTSTVYR